MFPVHLGIEPHALARARPASQHRRASRIGDRREIDREVGARPARSGDSGARHAQEIPRVHDPDLVGPGLPQDGGGILAPHDEDEMSAWISFANGADGGNVEEEIAQLILRTVEMDGADIRKGRVDLRGRLGLPHRQTILGGGAPLDLSFSSSSTFTRRSWQPTGMTEACCACSCL